MVLLNAETVEKLSGQSLVDPRIEVSGYLVTWFGGKKEKKGIPKKEIGELRLFLRDAIPYLQIVLRAAQHMQSEVDRNKGRYAAMEAFTPIIRLSHSSGDHIYHLVLTWDGEVFIDREEYIFLKARNGPGHQHSQYTVTRQVGVLDLVSESE